MVGIAMPPRDKLPPGPHRALVEALHQLYRQAGIPGIRKISQDSRHLGDALDLPDTLSHEGVSAILRGEGLPRWSKVECLVRILAAGAVGRPDVDAAVQRFHELWSSAAGVGSIKIKLADVQPSTSASTAAYIENARHEEDERTFAAGSDRYDEDDDSAWMAELLALEGDMEGLRLRADAGDKPAASWLAELLALQGDMEALRLRADAGDKPAARLLAMLSALQGDLKGLSRPADASDQAPREADVVDLIVGLQASVGAAKNRREEEAESAAARLPQPAPAAAFGLSRRSKADLRAAAKAAAKKGDPDPSKSTRAPACFEVLYRLALEQLHRQAALMVKDIQPDREVIAAYADIEGRESAADDLSEELERRIILVRRARERIIGRFQRFQTECHSIVANWARMDREMQEVYRRHYPYANHIGELVFPQLDLASIRFGDHGDFGLDALLPVQTTRGQAAVYKLSEALVERRSGDA
jgi:hypothetical protein